MNRDESRIARAGSWIDARLGHRSAIRAFLDSPIAGGARWAYAIGSALTALVAIEIVTGLALATAYAPSATTAWASVHYIQFVMPAGWLVRGVHYAASHAIVALLLAHVGQVALFGAYKAPREINWWIGLALFAITFGLAITGSRLPWDQAAYWALKVETGVVGSMPLIGGWAQAIAQGGADLGTLTLTRLYALHVAVLPMLLVLLIGAHVALFRKNGVTPSARADRSKVDPFFPHQAARDLGAALFVVALVLAIAWSAHGARLGAPADPASDYSARPEWYLAPLFALRKLMPAKLEALATFVIPGLAAAYLALLPFLDRAPTNALRPRIKALAPLALIVLGAAALTSSSIRRDAHDTQLQAALARDELRAAVAIDLAKSGVPAAGPLDMLAHDPELRGEALFTKSCAGCHVLGDLGDPKKANAPALDRWGMEYWVASMLDDPDADDRFGRTPFKSMMPSMLKPDPDRKPDDPPFKPMPDDEVKAIAAYLASIGEDDPDAPKRDAEALKKGESIVSARCTTCHLFKGEGDDSDQRLAPELSTWGSVAWIRAQIANPATKATYREAALDPKMKGHMPRFDAELAPGDLDLLARWVHARARGKTLR